MNITPVQTVAAALIAARQARQPADDSALAALLTSAEQAYAVQALVAQTLPGTGRRPAWKSGGPSRSAPLTHARLPDAGVWTSPAVTGQFHFHLRLIEAEIALRLGDDVTPAQAAALTPESASNLVEAMAVSIEVVDSRWQQGTQAAALLKLADLQSHGALVLGDWVPWVPRDWARQTCSVNIGQQPERIFTGTHSLGDPAWLLPQWLRHATRDGQTVPAGTVVTTGTWCGMLQAGAGDRVTARFDGVGHAEVQL